MPERLFDFVFSKTCQSCGILKPDMLGFSLVWSSEEDSRNSDDAGYYFVHHLPDGSGEPPQDKHVAFKGDTRRRIAVDHTEQELIMVAQGRNVFRHNRNGGRSERQLTRDEIVIARNIRFIGDHFYMVGAFRRILRRDGIDQWTDITGQLHSDLSINEKDDWGFEDVDGFDESELYAVGGRGDGWRFDGKDWHPLNLPTDVDLSSVCCAEDGQVYIGGSMHTVIRGRHDRWEVIHSAATNRGFGQILSYQGQALAIDEWGGAIYVISGSPVGPLDTGDFELPPAGALCMATGYGMLLMAGSGSAALFDGASWRRLF